jgi:hypothetical protein
MTVSFGSTMPQLVTTGGGSLSPQTTVLHPARPCYSFETTESRDRRDEPMKLTPTAAVAPVALALAALSLLVACGPKAGGNAAAAGGAPGAGAPAAGAPASGPDVEVNFADLPHQRAGLWKTVIDDGDGKPADMTSCVSGKLPAMPKMPAGCSQFTIKKTFLGAYVMDMNCATPDFTMVAHSVATGDFQSHMSADMTMTMSGKQMPSRTSKMHSEATYVGPCAPGQKFDDADDSNATG